MHELAVESQKLAIMPTSKVVEYFVKNQESPGTSRTYHSTIKYFLSWINKPYREITPFDALKYSEFLKSNKAEATTQRQISTLKKFYDFAMKCGLITGNPFAVVKQKAAPNRSAERFLTVKEIDKLLRALKETNEKHYVLGLLLVATGMRISEIWELSWSSFVEMPDNSICINVHRKGGEYQLLPLREDVWEIIKNFVGKEINPQDNSPIFLNPSKKRASSVTLRTWIESGVKKAGINKKATPHFLRHSFATTALDQKADIRDVSWYMGHKSLKTTSIYAHPTNKRVGEFIPLPNDNK
ncbi:MAG: tyrosine-type recombinase/integrase [Bacillota bacterium]|nr:tyrosine-type recombinase/integrase [Bacillota bacterium]